MLYYLQISITNFHYSNEEEEKKKILHKLLSPEF